MYKYIKMHKYIFLLCFLFFSCSESFDFEQKSDIRTKRNAIEIAQSAYYDCFAKNSRSNLKVDIKSIDVITNKSNRSSSTDTLLYIINFTDSLGFAIISASINNIPLLGISDSGTYNANDIEQYSNFDFFMNCVYNYAENTNNPLIINPPLDPIQLYCNPKLDVLWGQHYPYGSNFRNQIAGCSNIATAMIMSYFKQPQTMVIHYGQDTYNLNLDWTEICKHKKTGTDCNEDDAIYTHRILKTFIRQIGYDNHSIDLYNTGTSTYIENVLNSLITNGYTCSPFVSFSSFNYKNYLNSNYLVYVSGCTNTGAGHDWVMDGYKTLTQMLDNRPIFQTYCHYNWGADGRYNGYFLEGIFDISNAYEYDGEYDSQSKNFNRDVFCSAITFNEL